MEYEQKDILESILRTAPQNPVCIDLVSGFKIALVDILPSPLELKTFENLKAYMAERVTVAPYLITAPTGSGKSLLLAKW